MRTRNQHDTENRSGIVDFLSNIASKTQNGVVRVGEPSTHFCVVPLARHAYNLDTDAVLARPGDFVAADGNFRADYRGKRKERTKIKTQSGQSLRRVCRYHYRRHRYYFYRRVPVRDARLGVPWRSSFVSARAARATDSRSPPLFGRPVAITSVSGDGAHTEGGCTTLLLGPGDCCFSGRATDAKRAFELRDGSRKKPHTRPSSLSRPRDAFVSFSGFRSFVRRTAPHAPLRLSGNGYRRRRDKRIPRGVEKTLTRDATRCTRRDTPTRAPREPTLSLPKRRRAG